MAGRTDYKKKHPYLIQQELIMGEENQWVNQYMIFRKIPSDYWICCIRHWIGNLSSANQPNNKKFVRHTVDFLSSEELETLTSCVSYYVENGQVVIEDDLSVTDCQSQSHMQHGFECEECAEDFYFNFNTNAYNYICQHSHLRNK